MIQNRVSFWETSDGKGFFRGSKQNKTHLSIFVLDETIIVKIQIAWINSSTQGSQQI